MSDNNVEIKFGAENGPLKDGVNQAASSVEQSVGRMTGAFADMASKVKGHTFAVTDAANSMADGIKTPFDAVGGVLSGVMGKFAALASIVAGGAFFKSAIDETKQFTGEAVKLSKALGITVDEATVLNIALGDIYASSETFIGAATMMARQLRTNELAIRDMGIATRDSSGHLRPMNDIIMDSLGLLKDYKQGVDRTVAAQQLFGRGAAEAMQLLKLNANVLEEAKRKQEELGLTVGQKNVEDMARYKAAMNDVGDVMLALKKVIGDAVMPAFADMGEWFASIGPGAVEVLKVSIQSLMMMFYGLKNGVVIVVEVVKGALFTIAEPIRAVAAALYHLVQGDFDAARKELTEWPDQIAAAWKKAGQAILDSSLATNEAMERMLAPSKPAEKKTGKDLTMSEADPDKGKSRMSVWDVELDRQKLAHEKMNAEQGTFYAFGKQRESDYWNSILQRHDLSREERVGAEKKYIGILLDLRKDAFETEVMRLKTELDAFKNNQDERLRIAREIAEQVAQKYGTKSKEYEATQQAIVNIERAKKEQIKAINDEMRNGQQAAALFEIDMAERQAQLEVQLGIKTNAELLAQQADLENQRSKIKLAALKERQAALKLDPDMNPVEYAKVKEQIEEIERQHQLKMGEIRSKQVMESNKNYTSMFQTLQGGLQSVLTQFGKGTMTMGQLVRGLMGAVLDAVTGTLAKMATEWLMRQIQQRVMGKMTALTQITDASAVAGANAFASTAAIPIIGPELAPAAAMAASAGAMGFSSMLAAEKGFDVPAGMNPVTQLHQKEMVLPASQADVIRNMAANGGGSGQPVTVHISAVDAQSVRSLFMREGAALADAIQKQARNMNLTGTKLKGAR